MFFGSFLTWKTERQKKKKKSNYRSLQVTSASGSILPDTFSPTSVLHTFTLALFSPLTVPVNFFSFPSLGNTTSLVNSLISIPCPCLLYLLAQENEVISIRHGFGHANAEVHPSFTCFSGPRAGESVSKHILSRGNSFTSFCFLKKIKTAIKRFMNLDLWKKCKMEG